MMRPVITVEKFSALALTPMSEPCSPWPSERNATAIMRMPIWRAEAIMKTVPAKPAVSGAIVSLL